MSDIKRAHIPTYQPWFDGHEMSFVSFFLGGVVLIDRTLPNGWSRHFIHRHPVPALASAWGLIGLGTILVVPRLRRALGLSTDNYNLEAPGAYKQKWRQEPEI